MAENSSIEWTDATWNPTTGCTRVSEGCRNCYAFQLHDMRHKALLEGKKLPAQYAKPFKELQMFDDRLTTPLSWKKPKRIFVNSMSDLFHKDVPDRFIDSVFMAMGLCPWHTFQVLTKRPERMADYLNDAEREDRVRAWAEGFERNHHDLYHKCLDRMPSPEMDWPLPNVHLGTSVENQAAADERIPHLLRTPAAVRFLSCEPLLGKVVFKHTWHPGGHPATAYGKDALRIMREQGAGIDWVIVGGESGHGARPCDVAWIRSIVEQCKAAGVPCFVKQLGSVPEIEDNEAVTLGRQWQADGITGRHYTGRGNGSFVLNLRDKKGGDISEWPADLRVRELPAAKGTVSA